MKSKKQTTKRPPKKSRGITETDRIESLKREFDNICHTGGFDQDKLLELFNFDVDDRGHSTLVTMLRMAKKYRDLHSAPGGLAFLSLQKSLAANKINRVEYGPLVALLQNGVYELVVMTARGDSLAREQLEALKRIILPDEYDFRGKIGGVADHQPKKISKVLRGRELLEMMDRISGVVSPRIAGKVLSPRTLIEPKDRAGITPSDEQWCGDLVAKVASYKFNSKTSLMSLTIKIYLESLADKEVSLSDDDDENRMCREAIQIETDRQEKSPPTTGWVLNISRSETEWKSFMLPLVPLKPKKRKTKAA